MLTFGKLARRLFGGRNGRASTARAATPEAIVPDFRRFVPFSGEWSAIEEYRHFAGWVHAAVRPIAQTIAGLQMRVARERKPGSPAGGDLRPSREGFPAFVKAKSEDLELFNRHPVLDVLAAPNCAMTQWQLFYTTVVNLELTGTAYWWIVGRGADAAIWPLPSHWVQPDHSSGQPFGAWKLRPDGSATPRTIPGEEIAYFYYPDPSDPLGTSSPLRAHGKAVVADEQIQQAQGRAFQNGIFPGLAIIAGNVGGDEGDGPPLLTDAQRKQLITAIKRRYASVAAAGEPIILDALIRDIKKVSNTPTEMDFAGSGGITKRRITQGFGVNPAIMGEIEGVNRASSAVARKHFGEFCLNPKVELLSQTLTRAVAPKFSAEGEKLYLWLEPYRPDDREQKRLDYKLLAEFGAVSRNELRAALGNLPPLKEGGDSIPAKPNQELLSVRSKAKDAARQMFARNHETLETRLSGVLRGLFADQRADVLRRLRDLGTVPGTVDAVFEPSEWLEPFAEAVRPELRRAMFTGAVQELQNQGAKKKAAPEDLVVELSEAVREAIDGELDTIMSRPYWADMQQETRRRLAGALKESIENRENLYHLTVRIGDGAGGVLGEESNTARALRIARTETTGALNAGHQVELDELAQDGVVTGKEWSAILDGVTRDSHAAMHGRRVAPGEMFVVNGHAAPYPGHHSLPAEERVSCRCTILSVIAAEKK